METLHLITKEGITYGKVHDVLINLFPSYKIINDIKDKDIFLDKWPNRWQILFYPEDLVTKPDCDFSKKELTKIPFENAHVCDLEYAGLLVAKKIVEALLALYPELIIENDNDWIGPAQDFLDNKCTWINGIAPKD